MGKLNTSHLIEAMAWVAIAALFFIYSFEFNQKIEIYKFGATAWPRSILLMLMLVIAGNLFYQRANGSTPQPGRVGISEDDLDDAEKPLSSYLNIGSFLFLPLIFAWSQLIEHSLHAVGKISTQSTGEHACSLHFRFSTRSHFCNRSMLA